MHDSENGLMSMNGDVAETGLVKFTCKQVPVEIGGFVGFDELNKYRRKLRELGMIGVDANGIGFGNLSIRDGASSRFYITGSGTGGIAELLPSHYTRVVAYDFARNWLQCEGSMVASSESLTHAAVYESDPAVVAVIHCHDMKLWAALLHKVLTTPEQVEYGTPEMAYAVRGLFHNPVAVLHQRRSETGSAVMDRRYNETNVRKKRIFVMAGHEGGVVAFGKNLRSAFAKLEAHRASVIG